ncbi:MAG: precorrin-3B synthase [Xanthobacteraceae bacterium]|jgi:precorrin-3B synthase|nr:precorrin-3B synthase [Xanthobacteraceae bacterium]
MSVVTPATDATTATNDVATGGDGNVTKNATSDVARLRRGACPSLPAPMQTGDGLLARLQPLQPLTFEQLSGLARLARALGNGIVEVTARGKLQLRGLTSAGATRLPEAVAALGIVVPQGFPVEASALAGLDPVERFDPRPLAREISDRAAKLVLRLAPKASVVVDGGGELHLLALKADIGVTAGRGDNALILLANRPAGEVPPHRVPAIVVALLERLAARGPAARMANLLMEHGIEALRAEFALAPVSSVESKPPAEPVGLHALNDGTLALGLGLAFGQVEAEALQALAEAARAAGARHVEPASGRALLVVGLSLDASNSLKNNAAGLGSITDPADPRRRIFACAGRPACASARLDTHATAMRIAALAKGRDVHVSGCIKGCAHPAPAALTIVGLDEGAAIVVEGTPRSAPARVVPVSGLAQAVRELLEKEDA